MLGRTRFYSKNEKKYRKHLFWVPRQSKNLEAVKKFVKRWSTCLELKGYYDEKSQVFCIRKPALLLKSYEFIDLPSKDANLRHLLLMRYLPTNFLNLSGHNFNKTTYSPVRSPNRITFTFAFLASMVFKLISSRSYFGNEKSPGEPSGAYVERSNAGIPCLTKNNLSFFFLDCLNI